MSDKRRKGLQKYRRGKDEVSKLQQVGMTASVRKAVNVQIISSRTVRVRIVILCRQEH